MSDLKDIWNADEGSQQLSDEQLMAYLEGRLSDDDRLAVEAMLSADSMESDGLEGLQEFSPDEAKRMRRTLNSHLQQFLGKKRRTRRGLGNQQWNVIAIITVLLLICFVMFWMMRHP